MTRADASLFVSYRRADSPAVLKLCARLRARFGAVRIFLDVDDLAPGEPFAVALTATLAAVSVVLVIIGPRWLETLRERALEASRGHREDYVRLEVSAALARNVLVIPVLIVGGQMPTAPQLPGDLKALSGRQAFAIRDAFYEADVLRLSDAIADALSPPSDY